MNKFEELGIDVNISNAMKDMGWSEPTPIQTETIPAGMDGKDILAQAQTGTGKTGAYASIVLNRVPSGSKKPSVLILAPTRELAGQIEEEIYKLSKYSGHRSITVYGGASIDNQIHSIRKGRDVIVGTPGRMKDLLTREALDLSNVSEVVFDEADRMLDMGFANELNFIMDHVPKDRQTLLFSATLAKEIKQLAQRYMRSPVEISVSKDEICSDLTEQHFINVTKGDKRVVLETLLDKGRKTIVFCQTKHMSDRLHKSLKNEHEVGIIHGDITQGKREKAIKSYKMDRTKILIATDVAARGLDVNNIECVINYDIPNDIDTYLHRIGRTGRAGNAGVAISLVTREEKGFIKRCERETGKKIAEINAYEFEFPHRAAVAGSEPVERVEPVKKAFVPKVVPQKMKYPEGMVSIQINLGKSDGLGRTQISDVVKKMTNLDGQSVGRIGIGQTSSYVEIHSDSVNSVMEKMTGRDHKGKKLFVNIAPRKTPYKGHVKNVAV